jgi:hypothetical protein
MGDWSDCWLRVSAMEKLSLGSFLDESELMRDLDRRTSGVDERFLFTSPISSEEANRIKETSESYFLNSMTTKCHIFLTTLPYCLWHTSQYFEL